MHVNVSKIILDRFLHLYFLYHFLHLLIFVDVDSIVIWALMRETPRLRPAQLVDEDWCAGVTARIDLKGLCRDPL
jgi:hypothetical protein